MTAVDSVREKRFREGFTAPEVDRQKRGTSTMPASAATTWRGTPASVPPTSCLALASVAAMPVILWLTPVGPIRPAWWIVVLAAIGITVGTATAQAQAHAAAYRAGCAAERARCLRSLHDTALQSLDSMALASDDDHLAPAKALAMLRGSARQQATLLRRSLGELAEGPDSSEHRSLTAALTEVIDEVPASGPRVELVAGTDLPQPAPWQRDCLRDATREALTNVVKHATAHRVVVRVAAADDGVEVIVRDDGRGFDPELTTPGFGTRQSITARIREAGGAAGIDSWPGHGTRVRLWMPGRLTTTHPRRRPRR